MYIGFLSGSSPRVWGQEERRVHKRSQARIIPTRVGTSFRHLYSGNIAQDHPHACGDKKLLPKQIKGGTGSSPRVWGQETRWIFAKK